MAPQDGDHYEVLEISPSAASDEVKRAYRALSRQYHPDKAGSHLDEAGKQEHERRMKALNVAYQVLMSPSQRRAFDLSREVPASASIVGKQKQSQHNAYAAAAPVHRAASWGRHPFYKNSATPPPSRPGSSSTPRASGSGSGPVSGATDVPASGKTSSCTAPKSFGGVPKPRYQLGAKYTQRARQARRMDPSSYTTHIDGRCSEFHGSAANNPSSRVVDDFGPSDYKCPTYLQKKIDIAKEWEEAHCPAEAPEEQYKWRKASDNWLRNLKERKSARGQAAEDIPITACEA